MTTVTQHIRQHLEQQAFPRKVPDLATLKRIQWSDKFETLMRNRLILGGIRYETIADKQKSNGPKYKIVESAISRLNKYLVTGNQEHLVDAANLCLLEYECPTHKQAHFKSEDDGEHVQKAS